MRLPYLQVSSEAWSKARELAVVAGVDRFRAMCLMLDMWRWALEVEGDARPSGVVTGKRAAERLCGAVEWTGPAADLADALCEVGLIERLPDGLRIKGMDRYAGAWSKQDYERERKAEWRANKEAKSGTKSSSVRDTSGTSPGQTGTQSGTMSQKSPNVPRTDVDVDVDAKKLTTPPTRASARDESAPPLQDELDAVFLELRGSAYAWSMDEQQATRRLLQLAQGDTGEIVRRWRNALSRTRFPTCTGIKDLVRHWNAYAAPEAALPTFGKPDKPGGRDGLTKPPPSKGEPCAWCGQAGTEDRGGQWLCAPCVQKNDAYWASEAKKAAGGTP